jgi:hypothetical protein
MREREDYAAYDAARKVGGEIAKVLSANPNNPRIVTAVGIAEAIYSSVMDERRRCAVEIARLQKALDLAVSRGCDHCAKSIKSARAIASQPWQAPF